MRSGGPNAAADCISTMRKVWKRSSIMCSMRKIFLASRASDTGPTIRALNDLVAHAMPTSIRYQPDAPARVRLEEPSLARRASIEQHGTLAGASGWYLTFFLGGVMWRNR